MVCSATATESFAHKSDRHYVVRCEILPIVTYLAASSGENTEGWGERSFSISFQASMKQKGVFFQDTSIISVIYSDILEKSIYSIVL